MVIAASPEDDGSGGGELGRSVADLYSAAAAAAAAAAVRVFFFFLATVAADDDDDDDDAREGGVGGGGGGLSCVRTKVRGAPSDKEAMTLFKIRSGGGVELVELREESALRPFEESEVGPRCMRVLACSPIFSVVAVVPDVDLYQSRGKKSRQEIHARRPPNGKRGTVENARPFSYRLSMTWLNLTFSFASTRS